MKHNWMNYPTKSISKCTICGCMRYKNKKYGSTMYEKNGKEFENCAPKCDSLIQNQIK